MGSTLSRALFLRSRCHELGLRYGLRVRPPMFSRILLVSFLIAAAAVFTVPSLALAYGPVQGQSCSGVSLSPGANIQNAVDSHPAGTTFCLAAGTYVQQSVVPQNNDQFIGAYGAVLDGQNTTEHAFAGTAQNVVIQNLKIVNYHTKAQNGLFSDSPVHGDASTGWIVKNNELAYNWGAGLDLGNQMQVIGNYIHHNSQIGIDTNGAAANNGTMGVVVDSNEIAYNNYRHDFDPGWEAGGTKFWATSNLQVTNNYTHDNIGPGLWADTNNIGTTYANNDIENNPGGGIAHEVSYDAVIKNNVIKNNGRVFIYGWEYQPQILLNSSGGASTTGGQIEITGNTLISGPNGGAVGLEQQNRSTDSAWYGPHIVQNVYVHDNAIDQSSAAYQPSQAGVYPPQHGAYEDDGEQLIFTSRNNRFVNNTYYLGSQTLAGHAFNWMDNTFGVSTWQKYGQDTTGTFNYSAMSAAPAAYLVAAPSGTTNFASQTAVSSGSSVTLSWSASSATTCTGTGFPTGNAIAGSATVTPTQSATYGLTCNGPGGAASAQTTVIVASNLIPAANLTVYPAVIAAGGQAALSWSATNAAACSGSGFDTNDATSGSIPISRSNTTTYSVTCAGSGGSASAFATETVTMTDLLPEE